MTADLEARIRRIEDELALKALINSYHKRADALDWAGWAESFTEDAVFEFKSFGTMRGRQAIHDTCKAAMAHVYDAFQHYMVNLDFELAGDTATGTGNLVFVGLTDAAAPTRHYMAGGRYQWRFARIAGGWRIRQARLEWLWNNGADAERVFAEELAGAAR